MFEDRYEQMLANSATAAICAGPDNRIVSWNAAAEALLGYSAAEAIGQPLSIIIPPRGRGPCLRPRPRGEERPGAARRASGGSAGLPRRRARTAGRPVLVDVDREWSADVRRLAARYRGSPGGTATS
ncbi:PAS domain S-box protein [Novosphingobium flavum]|uniref:PAS domain S-box protein n=1 Tax=Novosphingobium aerophilum TaxID=2839843 RepID=A0A7X1F4K5_9SPHN|nr:PAS domain S-box protein [Novosphingobium aerophilum]